MLIAGSHWVVATEDVERITRFLESVFEIKPHFENAMFSEFVLSSGFRVAFFKPVGTTADYFTNQGSREGSAFGVTVTAVDETYARVAERFSECRVSGPPKSHPWGEKSFLLIDPDGNRWEIAQTPSADGMLVNRDDAPHP